jgi:trehalose/maltose transport system substrate-binding protein
MSPQWLSLYLALTGLSVDDPINKTALTEAVSWLGSIAPPSVLTMGGAESLRFFTDGNAAFLRYFPSGLILSEDPASLVRGRVGMADLPKGGLEGRHPLVLTGRGLAAMSMGNNGLAVFNDL